MKFIKILTIFTSFLFLNTTFAEQYLLKPTGKYEVGFQDFRVVNGTLLNGSYSCPGKTDLLYVKGQNETDFGKDNQIDFCREIMVRVYYPSWNLRPLPHEKYYGPGISDLQEEIRSAKIPGITEDDLKKLEKIKTFSIQNNQLIAGKFPVLIFDPGSGMEFQEYENTLEDLTSHGYIILALNNTFVGSSIAFPDGRIVHYPKVDWKLEDGDNSVLHDILFVRQILNSDNSYFYDLKNLMDLNKIGLFGHSMGAISVVEAMRTHPELFQAAVTLDAPPVAFGKEVLGKREFSQAEMAGFPNSPFLRLFAAEWRSLAGIITPKDDSFQLFANNYYSLLSNSEDNTTYTNHGSFSDLSTLQYQPTIKLYVAAESGILGTADGWHITKVINKNILEFFNQYLKNNPSENLNSCIPFSNDTMLTCQNTY